MGRERRGTFVSGAGIVAAAYSPPPPPTSSGPLSCWITFSPNHETAFTVSGASGNLSGQGYGILQADHSGGVAPYIESYSFQNEPSGKLGVTDNGRGADTISYAGLALNEVESGWIRYAVTDGAGTTVTARYPATGSLSITRSS